MSQMNTDALLKWAAIPADKVVDIFDVRAYSALNDAADRALATLWGLNERDRLVAGLVREYARAELAAQRCAVEVEALAKERDVLRMQLGKARKQLERAKVDGDESDSAA